MQQRTELVHCLERQSLVKNKEQLTKRCKLVLFVMKLNYIEKKKQEIGDLITFCIAKTRQETITPFFLQRHFASDRLRSTSQNEAPRDFQPYDWRKTASSK